MRGRRLSVAGLMGLVLISAIGLSAIRSGSEIWAGLMFLTALFTLMLAVVGALCRTGAERAWWLGFALFGGAYLCVEVIFSHPLIGLFTGSGLVCYTTQPTVTGFVHFVEAFFRDAAKQSLEPLGGDPVVPRLDEFVLPICHSLFSLVIATCGGAVSWWLFGEETSTERSVLPTSPKISEARENSVRWKQVLGVTIVALGFSLLIGIGLKHSPWLTAGLMFLTTWGLLGTVVLGWLLGQGRQRTIARGMAIFGVGYMLLVFHLGTLAPPNAAFESVNHLINLSRPWLPRHVPEDPPLTSTIDRLNERILTALERPTSFRYPTETPLEDILNAVKESTRDSAGMTIAIYANPIALQEEEKTLRSTLSIDLEGVPLRTSLGLALDQLGLTYGIRGGVLVIGSKSEMSTVLPGDRDPLLVIGQCLFALLAASIGGVASATLARSASV